ncbi:MAG: HIT family protein [Candidatus Woesearchaeota archaeon]
MAEDNCFFCKVIKEDIGVFYENNYFYSRFDRYPVSPGHTEIIPKRHVISLTDLTIPERHSLIDSVEDTLKILKSYPLKDMYIEFTKELKDIDPNSKWYNEMCKNPGDATTRAFATKMLTHVGIDKTINDYNFGNNDGLYAGRTVDHLHMHIIPRYQGDAIDHRFGIRWIIPELANYKK